MRTADFDYALPAELIAQSPAEQRDGSRLLVFNRLSGTVNHLRFNQFQTLLKPGDLLVFNDSRVIRARLRGVKSDTGGEVELLLTEETERNEWWVMARPGKRLRPGTKIELHNGRRLPVGISATVLGKNAEGHCHVRFTGVDDIRNALDAIGETPLPPYIKRDNGSVGAGDVERYQTVYARADGSVAAPTAGLHFTEEMMLSLWMAGVEMCFVTLHVGLGTFAPVKADQLANHVMHSERFEVSETTAAKVQRAKAEGRRVVAIGTTTVRVLESVAASNHGQVVAGAGSTSIFIHPPYQFRVVDALLTNFHLPQSTLLMLVSAFAAPGEIAGREKMLAVYAEAIRERYHFFSYGDAMFIE